MNGPGAGVRNGQELELRFPTQQIVIEEEVESQAQSETVSFFPAFPFSTLA